MIEQAKTVINNRKWEYTTVKKRFGFRQLETAGNRKKRMDIERYIKGYRLNETGKDR